MSFYLETQRAGIDWLLNPASPELGELAREAEARAVDSACDPRGLADDADELRRLIRERHFGVATRHVAMPDDELDAWEKRLEARPRTWGEAVTELQHDLRDALRDQHIRLRGGAPRFEPSLRGQPAVEEQRIGDTVVLIVRRLWGDSDDDRLLEAWVARADEHFAYERIVVDLRGNTGGNDGYTFDWASSCFDAAPTFVRDWTWCVRGTPVGIWNSATWGEVRDGVAPLHDSRHDPRSGDTLEVVADEEGLEVGHKPWRGRMVVLVDRRTASSGESSAWLLRAGLGARVVGEPTLGMIEYGNVVPYVLPRSGLVIHLPTKRNDFGLPVEGRGFPVDAPLDPETPVEDVVRDFDLFV
ncbi:MAG TPA: S41 family peptidase [Gaiellaceae bacterium]